MVIDHIGIVVRNLEQAIEEWESLFGYVKNSDIVTNTRQKVRVVFLKKIGSITVKLIDPTEPESPVWVFCRKGGGLHHLCFRCDDLKVDVRALQAKGARLIVPPQPGEAFCNNDIAFLFAPNNLNVELIDTNEKQGWPEGAQ